MVEASLATPTSGRAVPNMRVERTDFVSVPVTDTAFKDPDGDQLMLHRRYATRD
jgi:hypothetical protein